MPGAAENERREGGRQKHRNYAFDSEEPWVKTRRRKNNERAPESSAAAGPPQLVHTDTRLFINHATVLESAYNISSRA